MPLTTKQVTDLAEQLDQEWIPPTLVLFASGLDVKLDNVASGRTFKERAFRFIDHMNSLVPPRDGEFLESLRREGNAKLKAAAAEFLRRHFYPSTGDAHDAIVLGKTAFVDRDNLRQAVRDFTNPTTTRHAS